MKLLRKKAYVILQESVMRNEPLVASALVSLLPVIAPPPNFVEELGRNLVVEAIQQQEEPHSFPDFALLVMGAMVSLVVLLLVVGLIWLIWRRRRDAEPELPL